jgi:hypothetical protein
LLVLLFPNRFHFLDRHAHLDGDEHLGQVAGREQSLDLAALQVIRRREEAYFVLLACTLIGGLVS